MRGDDTVRLTKKVFHDLAIWMVCFGLCIGVVFPFFVMLLGVPSEIALTLTFFLACLGAGALAGGINFALARLVVGARMKVLAHSMTHVEENLLEMTATGDLSICSPEECLIEVDSEDEIGESAEAFNRLVGALSASMETQVAVRTLGEILASQLELTALPLRRSTSSCSTPKQTPEHYSLMQEDNLRSTQRREFVMQRFLCQAITCALLGSRKKSNGSTFQTS